MRKSKLARTLMSLFTVAMLAMTVPGCGQTPTDIGGDEDPPPDSGCTFIDGVMVCVD